MFLEEFIELYHASHPINKLKPLDDIDYNCFKFKTIGLPIALSSSKKHLDVRPRVKYLCPFFQQNKYFWTIPIETIS